MSGEDRIVSFLFFVMYLGNLMVKIAASISLLRHRIYHTGIALKLGKVGWALAQESAHVGPRPQPTRVEEVGETALGYLKAGLDLYIIAIYNIIYHAENY